MGDFGNFKKKRHAVLDVEGTRRKINATLSVNKVLE